MVSICRDVAGCSSGELCLMRAKIFSSRRKFSISQLLRPSHCDTFWGAECPGKSALRCKCCYRSVARSQFNLTAFSLGSSGFVALMMTHLWDTRTRSICIHPTKD